MKLKSETPARLDVSLTAHRLYGCLDMSGNVWEWTNSKKEKYPYKNDQREDGKGDRFVLRGGAWDNHVVNARCAYRYDYPRDYQWNSAVFVWWLRSLSLALDLLVSEF